MLSTLYLNGALGLKTLFIPCEENEFYPRILDGKRVALYAVFFILVKIFIVGYALVIPFEAFTAPNVLAAQANRVFWLTNDFRREKGLPGLKRVDLLDRSADARASDMASTGYLGSTSPNGDTFPSFLDQSGYAYAFAGENMAMGFAEPLDVVDAWIKSQTHFDNLTERNFSDSGVGMRAGTNNGEPTIFIVEHFGTPLDSKSKTDQTAFIAQWPSQAVPSAGVGVSGTDLAYDRTRSRVSWADNGDGRTKISVRAVVTGSVRAAEAIVQGYPIDLAPDIGDAETYVGSVLVTEPPDRLFHVIVASTMTITGKDGSTIRDSIAFERPKSAGMSPWKKYQYARSWFTPVFSVFSAAYWVYLAYFILFGISLLLTILIEFREQHPHVVFRTIGFLGLILLLWLV